VIWSNTSIPISDLLLQWATNDAVDILVFQANYSGGMDPFGREVEEMDTSSSPDRMEDPPTHPQNEPAGMDTSSSPDGMEDPHAHPQNEPAGMDTLPPPLPLVPQYTAWPFHDNSHPRHHDSGHYDNTTELYLEDGEDLPSPMEETTYIEHMRGVAQYPLEKTGQHRSQEMVTGRLPS
jgi:hypothetical protein